MRDFKKIEYTMLTTGKHDTVEESPKQQKERGERPWQYMGMMGLIR